MHPDRNHGRGILFASLLSAALASSSARFASAQTFPALPSTSPKPSAQVPASSAPSAAQSSPLPSVQAAQPHRARVEFVGDQLSIAADNSSLNQILRDIARLTGIKITGGVADERVFGTYGPANASAVLEALLNGTGSNLLLLENSQHDPRELVLTPRQGGATPPNPGAATAAASARDEDPDLPPQLSNRLGRSHSNLPPGAIRQDFTSRPVQDVPPIGGAPLAGFPAAEGAQPSPAESGAETTQQSPNGVKTPQQIFDQLLRMRQAQPPAGAAPPPTPPE